MINLPNSLAKGENLTFALNKSLVIAAVSDSYWSDSANISKCIVVYKSTSGHQRKRLEFDFSQESPTVVAEWSAKARNVFEIEEIVLIDFDSGSYTIPRASLPSGKGISFAGESDGSGSVVTQVVHNYFPNGAINDMVTDGTNVYIGGNFTALRFPAWNSAVIDMSTAASKQIGGAILPAFDGAIRAIVFDGADTIFVGGAFKYMDGVKRVNLAKLNRSGGRWVSDLSFNVSGRNQPYEKTSTDQGVWSLKIAGNLLLIGTHYYGSDTVAQWTDGAGTAITGLTARYFFAVDKDSGVFQFGGSPSLPYTTNQGYCASIEVDGDNIYLGGGITTTGTGFPFSVKRYSVSSQSDTTPATIAAFSSSGVTGGVKYILKVSPDGLYVSSGFVRPYSSGNNDYRPVRLKLSDMSRDTTFSPPVSTTTEWRNIGAMALDASGNLIVGGNLPTATNYSGKKYVFKLAKTNGSVISGFDSGSTFARGGSTSYVNKIIQFGTSLYVFGQFDGRAGVSDPVTCINVAKVDAETGAIDPSFASKDQLGVSSSEIFYDGAIDGTSLMAFGKVEGWGGYSRQGVAKLAKDSDGNWKVVEAFNPGTGGTAVNTLALSGSDLYIGGTFTTWAGSARNRVAKLNATTGALDPSFGVGVFTSGVTTGQFNGVTNTVNKVLVDGSDLVIAGAFTTYSKRSSASSNTTPATPYWIRVNVPTNTETVPTAAVNGAINDVAIDGSNAIFAGAFTSWGGVTLRAVVKGDKTTGAITSGWSSPSYGTAGAGYRVRVVGTNVFVGSYTNNVGGTSGTSGIFALNKDTGAVSKTYPYGTTFGINTCHMEAGSFLEDGTYLYVLSSRSTVSQLYSVRRIIKSTLAFDSTFGFNSDGYAGARIYAAALASGEICVSVEGSISLGRFTPAGKRLYSINPSDASQNSNI